MAASTSQTMSDSPRGEDSDERCVASYTITTLSCPHHANSIFAGSYKFFTPEEPEARLGLTTGEIFVAPPRTSDDFLETLRRLFQDICLKMECRYLYLSCGGGVPDKNDMSSIPDHPTDVYCDSCSEVNRLNGISGGVAVLLPCSVCSSWCSAWRRLRQLWTSANRWVTLYGNRWWCALPWLDAWWFGQLAGRVALFFGISFARQNEWRDSSGTTSRWDTTSSTAIWSEAHMLSSTIRHAVWNSSCAFRGVNIITETCFICIFKDHIDADCSWTRAKI